MIAWGTGKAMAYSPKLRKINIQNLGIEIDLMQLNNIEINHELELIKRESQYVVKLGRELDK